VINAVLQRPYRSVGGRLDLSHVKFFGGQNCTGTGFIRVLILPVSFRQRSVFRAVTAEGQKS